jgi:hypothetical protein
MIDELPPQAGAKIKKSARKRESERFEFCFESRNPSPRWSQLRVVICPWGERRPLGDPSGNMKKGSSPVV